METVDCQICGEDRTEPVIQQTDLRHALSEKVFVIVQCRNCGFRFVNPRPTQKEITFFYPEEFWGPPTTPRRYSKIKRWILEDFYNYPSIKPATLFLNIRKVLLWPEKLRRAFCGQYFLPWIGKGRILDLGCGIGMELAIHAQQGWEAYGLDLSEVCVAQAQKILGNRVQVGDLHSAPFQNNFFDVVLISHTLEHVFNLDDILQETKKILTDNGMLVIRVPNSGSLEAKIFGKWWMPLDLPRHIYHFTKSSITALLKKNGFQIITIQTGTTCAHFMSSLEWVFTYKLKKHLRGKEFIEKFFARPLCLILGNCKIGTEIIVHAKKV